MSDLHIDDWIPELVLGTLDPIARAEANAHLTTCDRCARELSSCRDLTTELAMSLDESAPPAAVRANVLGAITGAAPFDGFVRRFSRIFQLDEDASRVVLASGEGGKGWESYIPGVELFHFEPGPALAGVDAGLVRFAASLAYPSHTHVGEEIMFVLAGGLREDITGRVLQPGDIHVMPGGSSHSFSIDRSEICVAAVLLNGGLPIFDDSRSSLRALADAPRCLPGSGAPSDRPTGSAPQGGIHVSDGERIIHCKKLDKDLPGVRRRPYKNELGEKIWNEISQEAWEMWLKDSVKLINTYRVDLASAEGQKFMLKQAAVYFGFEQGDVAETAWTPPKEG